MSAITPSQLRADFPAFASTAKYPDGMVNVWANAAGLPFDPGRWGDLITIGQELFIAHNLVLDGMATQEASRGGLVGFAKGAVSAEGGDKVSVSYDVAGAMDPKAGHWNSTYFGQRLWRLIQMAGVGPFQVGPDPCGGLYGGPWPSG